jgi:hypothetical protein|tara:strand:- start:303 stop:626 length:324 start_codon:yes stop_codon:yes gene_type:complete
MMARRVSALLVLLLVLALLLDPVSAGGGGVCPAESCRECVTLGCGWVGNDLQCTKKGLFGFGKGVTTVVTQCTPLRDALVRLADNSPALSAKLVATYDFIREKITVK